MPLTKSSVKRPVVNVGDDLATQLLPTGEHAQSVALIDETGNQAGGLSSPLQVTVTNQANVSGRIASDRDLFGRTRVAPPVTLFESVLEYDSRPNLWGGSPVPNTGTFTHIPTQASVSLNVAASQKIVRRTHEHFKYQAGKATTAYLTSLIGTSIGTIRRVGIFDDYDGVFLMDDGIGISIVFRSSVSGSVVDTVVPQANWSEDILDGTGLSGRTIDFSKVQILVFEAQGMAVGEIRVGFLIDAVVTYAHEFHSANVITGRPIAKSSLPISYEISSTTGSGSLIQYDSSVISEGGLSKSEEAGFIFSCNNGIAGVAVSPSITPVLSIKPSLLFKGRQFDGSIIINDFQLLSESTNIFWQIVLNPVLTGPIWTPVDLESSAECDTASTGILGGSVILSGYAQRKGSGIFEIPLSKSPLSVSSDNLSSDIISLCVADIQGNLGNVFASFNFSESY